mgnify:CR=1 FL=1
MSFLPVSFVAHHNNVLIKYLVNVFSLFHLSLFFEIKIKSGVSIRQSIIVLLAGGLVVVLDVLLCGVR